MNDVAEKRNAAHQEGNRLLGSPSDSLGGYVALGTGPAQRLRRGLAIFVMVSGGLFTGLMTTALSPSMVAIKAHFGQNASAALVAQLVITTASLGVVVGGPLSGWLIEKFGVRRMLLAALPLYGLCGSAGLLLESPAALFISRFGLGMGAATVFTGTITLLGDSFVGGGRAKLLGFKTTVAAAFAVVSVMLSARIAEAAGWRMAFSMYGVLALFILIIVYFSVEDAAHKRGAADKPVAGALLNLWPVYAVVLFISTITILNQTQMPLLLAADHDVAPTTIAGVISAGTISYTIGSLFYGVLQQKLGAYRMFALCLALIGAGAAVLGFSHELYLSAFGAILLGWGGGMMQPYMLNVLLDRAAPEMRGRAIGLLSPAVNSGQFLSPLLFFALLSTGLGVHGAFLTIGGCLFLSALIGLRTGVPKFRAASSEREVLPTS